MQFALLGTLQVVGSDGATYELRGAKPRAIVALLAVRHGAVVTIDELVDVVWSGEPPPSATNALHVQISKLRRALGQGTDVLPLRTVNQGYVLDAEPDDIDIVRFERLTREGRACVAEQRFGDAAAALDTALALWRGPALAEFAFEDFAAAERLRLDELRSAAQESLVDARLGLGQHELLVPELEALLSATPLRERLWGQLMLALYRAGRQADALRAYTRARAALVDEMGIEPGAELRRLQQRILEQDPSLAASAAPPAAVDSPPRTFTTNVRGELSTFVGRDAEVAATAELVAVRRLVTLVGPGGVGKTRMAAEVARRVGDAWRDGSWMLELYATGSPDGVARSLLAAFGGPAGGRPDGSGDVRAAVDVVAPALGDAALLLVLDNCEHVLADAGTAATLLLQACPNLHVLATSRAVLDVAGEAVRQVQPLAIDDAVALFGARGVDARDGFAIDGSNADLVRSICERVDCLPLGIELAAARLRAFSPAQLDTRLGEHLGAIAATGETRANRHRTMPATVEWSYDLLFEYERVLLRRLATFRGSFGLDAVEWVAADDQLDATDVAETLARLVDKSLVGVESGDHEPRYRLLRTVRDFASHAADQLGETATLRGRHAAWVAELAAAAYEGVRGPDEAAWSRRLSAEAANIDAALAWARDGGDVLTGLVTCTDLTWFALTSTALPSMLDDFLALVERAADAPRRLRARALAWLGLLGAGLPGAPALSKEAIELARAEGDPALLAHALLTAAMPMSRHVDLAAQAAVFAREGRDLAVAAGDRWFVGSSYAIEGNALALRLDGLDAAADLLEEAARHYHAIGSLASEEINATYLSQVHEDRGDLARAEEVLLPFALAHTAVDSAGSILAVARLTWIALRRGDLAGAEGFAGQLAVSSAVRQRRLYWGAARFAAGHVKLVAGDLDAALAALTAALDMHTEIGFERFVIHEHALLGRLAQLQGREIDATTHHAEAIQRARRFAMPLPLVVALEAAGTSALHRGDIDVAADLQAEADALRARHGLAPTATEAAAAQRPVSAT